MNLPDGKVCTHAVNCLPCPYRLRNTAAQMAAARIISRLELRLALSTVARFDRLLPQRFPSSPKAPRAFVTTATSGLVSDWDIRSYGRQLVRPHTDSCCVVRVS
jgi:hypothetical protein